MKLSIVFIKIIFEMLRVECRNIRVTFEALQDDL